MDNLATPVENEVELSQNGMPFEQRLKVLRHHRDYFRHYLNTSVGYQANVALSFSGNKPVDASSNDSNSNQLVANQIDETNCVIQDFWQMHINNRGDPFTPSGYVLETKNMEVAVLDYFAKLWRIDECKSPKKTIRDYWGYVNSLGATEANILALCNARDYLTGKPLMYSQEGTTEVPEVSITANYENIATDTDNASSPLVFYSQEAYYGHAKTFNMLQIKSFNDAGSGQFLCPLKYPEDYPSSFSIDFLDQNGWPNAVPCDGNDVMHIPSLLKLVSAFLARGYPPIVIFTSGSTSTGAYDAPQEAINQLVPILKQHRMYKRRVHSSQNPDKYEIRNGFWFHVDGALGAVHLPFLEMAINEGTVQNMFSDGFPVFDFRIPEVTSMSMSIYKWFGLPFPAAIYMMRRDHQLRPLSTPGFEHVLDNTLSGSRSGHGALLTWDLLSKHSYQDFTAEVVRAEKLILFLVQKLQELEKVHDEDLWIFRSPGSLMVSFKQPKKEVVFKFSLPDFVRVVNVVNNEGVSKLERRRCARISVMPHVQLEHLEMILFELKSPGAFKVENM